MVGLGRGLIGIRIASVGGRGGGGVFGGGRIVGLGGVGGVPLSWDKDGSFLFILKT